MPKGTSHVSKAWGGSGDLIIEGRLGVNGQSPVPHTAGWAGGIHTWDLESLQIQQAQLRQTLMRIEGASEVLGELLEDGAAPATPNGEQAD